VIAAQIARHVAILCDEDPRRIGHAPPVPPHAVPWRDPHELHGREFDLWRIHDALFAEDDPAIGGQVAAVTGPGGEGQDDAGRAVRPAVRRRLPRWRVHAWAGSPGAGPALTSGSATTCQTTSTCRHSRRCSYPRRRAGRWRRPSTNSRLGTSEQASNGVADIDRSVAFVDSHRKEESKPQRQRITDSEGTGVVQSCMGLRSARRRRMSNDHCGPAPAFATDGLTPVRPTVDTRRGSLALAVVRDPPSTTFADEMRVTWRELGVFEAPRRQLKARVPTFCRSCC
jgi:hypothetical protein